MLYDVICLWIADIIDTRLTRLQDMLALLPRLMISLTISGMASSAAGSTWTNLGRPRGAAGCATCKALTPPGRFVGVTVLPASRMAVQQGVVGLRFPSGSPLHPNSTALTAAQERLAFRCTLEGFHIDLSLSEGQAPFHGHVCRGTQHVKDL